MYTLFSSLVQDYRYVASPNVDMHLVQKYVKRAEWNSVSSCVPIYVVWTDSLTGTVTCSPQIRDPCPHLRVKVNSLRGLSPRANYTDRSAAAGRRS
jgi:hypothetical protein